MTYIDLSHFFGPTMPGYPGDPPSGLRVAGYTDEAQACPLFELTTGMHVGTHLDAPLHFVPGGADISTLPVSRFVGCGVLIDARGRTSIGVAALEGVELRPGDLALVCSGWSARFREANYYHDYPEVTTEFAEALIGARVSLLGLDTPSPDRAPYAIHRLLFSSNVLIVENLTNLDALIGVPEFEVFSLPMRIQA